jgi:ech hydrogenase subunit B
MNLNPDVLFILIGLAAGPVIGGFVSGIDRVVTARCQSRIGPPLVQPFYDVAKLFSKESMVVNIWQVFCAYAYLAAASISVVLFFLRSDLLLILLIQAVGAVFLVVGAFSSTSPFSQVGAHRELLQILCYEPLLILVAVGVYLQTGSFKIGGVFAEERPLLLHLPFLFVALGYALTIKLRKSPLDLSTSHHGHQELVKGLLTDYSGPFLALIEIGHWYEVVLMLGLCGLFWATSLPSMVVLVAVTYFLEILMDNVCARLNWRWMLGYIWAVGLTLSVFNLVWLTLRQ